MGLEEQFKHFDLDSSGDLSSFEFSKALRDASISLSDEVFINFKDPFFKRKHLPLISH